MFSAARAVGILGATAMLLACSDSTGAGGGAGGGSYTPVWITASWTGGAAGAPNDRTDREPESWKGLLCPASATGLVNHANGFAGLNITNQCNILITYAICATKGSLAQPQLGLSECATDPFDTPLTQFKIIPLNPGNLGDYINATETLSIQVFYCSDQTQLITGPVRCIG